MTRPIPVLPATLMVAALALMGVPANTAKTAPSLPAWKGEGQVVWTQAPDGRVKARVYSSARLSERPVLVVWLHGDLGPGSESYETALQLAGLSDNVVAAGLLRPGYTDVEGQTSAGRKGRAIGDNYTAEAADDVHAVIGELKSRVHPRAVIIMGHSGGAGVAANLMGRHPEDADAAVLIACSCDPRGFMDRWKREHFGVPKDLPNPSLEPLALAPNVSRKTLVRMVVGSNDTVVLAGPSQAYAAALKRNGVDVQLAIVNGADHVSVLRSDAVRQAVAEVIAAEGGKVRGPRK
jgi:pimeloyl-ACP methyl ester carboxylesterase